MWLWWKTQLASINKRVDSKIKKMYAFVLDLSLSIGHNVRNFIRTLPTDLLLCYPTQSSFHNLCDDAGLRVPPSLRSLLGLGLNFCLKPTTPSKPPHVNYKRFIKDYHSRIMFSNAPEKELDGDLYLKNDELEPIAPECPDLYWCGQCFETRLRSAFHNIKFQPNITYCPTNVWHFNGLATIHKS